MINLLRTRGLQRTGGKWLRAQSIRSCPVGCLAMHGHTSLMFGHARKLLRAMQSSAFVRLLPTTSNSYVSDQHFYLKSACEFQWALLLSLKHNS
jgi:hypothetical protein